MPRPCVASWCPKEASRHSWPITGVSCSPTRCSRTSSRRAEVDLRCPPTWWLLSWCSKPSRGSRTAMPLGRCGIGSAGRWPAGWPSTTRVLTTRCSPIGAPDCAPLIIPSAFSTPCAAVIEATGVLKGKTRRALDSTLLDDAVATQDTVTQLIAAIRRVRRVVPGAAAVALGAQDYEASGKPLIAWDDPVAKAALVDCLGQRCPRACSGPSEATEQAGEAAAALGSVGPRRRPRRRTR